MTLASGISLPTQLSDIISVDLETTLQGEIRHIGAITTSGSTWQSKQCGKGYLNDTLSKLDQFAENSRFLLGHNLIGHDIPVLKTINSSLNILKKPVIDTLFLSPLAFPKNPYHRLIKDYKLVRDAINDPVADARLALSIFQEQYQAFQSMAKSEPDLLRFYHYCFTTAKVVSGESDCDGLAAVFHSLVDDPYQYDWEVLKALINLCKGLACPKQIKRIALRYLPKSNMRAMLPYCIAWLKVSGGNSVLPPWVRNRFPEIPTMLKQLRDVHCGNDDCAFCQENHDPVKQLQQYFNYPDFRLSKDGTPLQRNIVQEGMNDQSLLGILPTGGGKSICFQIPALVRYHRRGLLTVVISPLQALMKDQVDNLKKKTGSMAVGAIYGMLTPPERGAVLEQVRMGDIGILYISPEQLRNKSVINTLNQREIGCWVFDEAHCLSKWGHDFRPDYLYCGRFIREQSEQLKLPVPPVACYTATAKTDVIDDICQHFRDRINQELRLFQGGVERTNLSYEVHLVTQASKNARVAELIEERLPETGSCVVYCATRKHTEELTTFLAKKGLDATYFHGGLDAAKKKEVLEHFIEGHPPIICATNAFGMGVDKDNVRLVVHADIPGSLENYLQEAGRAGRDERPAECVLLFDEQDIETQFKLGALSEVRLKDIQQILKGLRRLEKKPGQDVVITTGELLRSDHVNTSFNLDDKSADTKVKTAIAWLERSGFMERNENANQVFQGKPLFATLEEAALKLDKLQLSPYKRKQWELIINALINADPDEGLSADLLAEQIGREIKDENQRNEINTTLVMDILNQMGDAGLVSSGLLMTAFLRPKGRNNARASFKKLCELEQQMVSTLQEEHPDDHEQNTLPLDLRKLNQHLLDKQLDYSNPDLLRNLLKSLSEDGKGLAGSRGSLEFNYIYKDHYSIKLGRSWNTLTQIMERRHTLAQSILDVLYTALKKGEESSQSEVKVEFSLETLREAISKDMTLNVDQSKVLPAIERGLLFLHEQNIIILQHGLAVFRQAMTMKMNDEAKGRRYNKGDYDPLARHYKARVTQVHVMNEYVRLGQENMVAALRLVQDYFEQDNVTFLNRYFRDRKKLLELATSQQSLKTIVEDLGNPQQQAIVQAPSDRNMLVLAGPGAGKTKVVVHRCAYLMRIERVRPYSILVLCYNHSAALTLRKRLQTLLGNEAREITVQTFHGLAMRLTGASIDQKKQQDFNFDELIPKATALLRGEILLPGIAGDQARERLLAGFQHILVDEYQDIDELQYNMISAIAGRSLEDGDDKLSIMAVGDDDQSIYGFRQANVRFIRQFEDDYQAERHYLVQNYRSTQHIIKSANSLISHNKDRMKTEHAIAINDNRRAQPEGGLLAQLDPIVHGKVHILSSENLVHQTLAVLQEIIRLKTLIHDLRWQDIAILARNGISKPELSHIRSALEQHHIPTSLPLESGQSIPLARVREFHLALSKLNQHQHELANTEKLRLWLDELELSNSIWRSKLYDILDNWSVESGNTELPVSAFTTSLLDYLRETRREQRLGEGVHLGTVHGSKGMEFRVVIILDGGWQLRHEINTEEERRLFYVAMTRAMEQLVIIRRHDQSNPHLPLTSENNSLFREGSSEGSYVPQHYSLLGMRDLYLSYAGRMDTNHPIHQHLRSMNAGDLVGIRKSSALIEFLNQDQPVISLSRQKSQDWLQGRTIQSQGRIIAMVKRLRQDSEEKYQNSHKCEEWEIPVIEVTY